MGYLPVCSEAELKISFFITQSFSTISLVSFQDKKKTSYSVISINNKSYPLPFCK